MRYFCTTKDGEIHNHWFGGGFDLTPYILFEEDCYDWHKSAKNACDQTDSNFYKTFKKNCDEYFYIPHLKQSTEMSLIFCEKLESHWIKAFNSQGYLQHLLDILKI